AVRARRGDRAVREARALGRIRSARAGGFADRVRIPDRRRRRRAMIAQPDYFANHERARKFPWTLYHGPIERDLSRFLANVQGDVLVVGCGLLHEMDEAPGGLRYTVVDIDPRAVDAVMARRDPRIVAAHVVAPEDPVELGRQFDAIYAKEVVEHV